MFSKKKKKESKFFYNPMKLTEALKELGEEFDKKEAWLYYGAILLLALLLGLLFELRWYFMVIVFVGYVLCIPKMIINQKRHAYELRRFKDVNEYMSQMAQSFTDTKNVIKSLQDTEDSFSNGRMADTLSEALSIIDKGSYDIVAAEKQALDLIVSRYDCEKLRNLHQYFLRAQERGGECEKEFAILESVRRIWETAVKDYHAKIKWDKMMGTLLYFCVLVVCVFTMHILPPEIEIIDVLMTQAVNTVLLLVFVIYYIFLDNRLNASLLRDGKEMTREKADSYFAYLQGFDAKKERMKYIGYTVIICGVALALVVIHPTKVTVAIALVLVVIAFNLHTIMLYIVRNILKSEIEMAFPKWLFDIMLLIQRESVEGAILQSVEKAPPVLQAELNRISNILMFKAHDPDAYMSFMADFNVDGIGESMRKLYTLAMGTGGVKADVMNEIIKSNMELLGTAEKEKISRKGDFSEVFQTMPVIFVTFGMMSYCVVMVYAVLMYIMDML